MARIRSIHPNACKSRKLARSSAEAERCYWRLQPHCDDEGRVEDEPDVLASLLFQANRDIDAADADGWLEELAQVGLIVRYSYDTRRVIQVCDWDAYQHPQKPKKSALPADPDNNSGTSTRRLPDQSRSGIARSRSGVGEGEGAGAGDAREAMLSDAIVVVMGRRNSADRSERKADPTAWLAAAARDIRTELLAAEHLAVIPVSDSTELANLISSPPKPPPQRPDTLEAERNRDCPLCHGSMMATDDQGAYPCPTCNP